MLKHVLAFLDADDIWYENKIEKQVKLHKTHKVSFSCSAYRKNFKEKYISEKFHSNVDRYDRH